MSPPATVILLLGLGLATGAATLCGGLLALGLKSRIHLILGLSAGAVIGVALLELLPEALEAGYPAHSFSALAGYVGFGFVVYMLADRAIVVGAGEIAKRRGHLGAGGLTLHSVFDGVAIGLAFQASATVGVVVAAAVMAHDFADGVNTVNLALSGASSVKTARRWLLADALAPMTGLLLTRLVRFPSGALAILLALFTGAFLYIGAGNLISESHRRHPRLWTTVATVLGFAFIWAVVEVARANGV